MANRTTQRKKIGWILGVTVAILAMVISFLAYSSQILRRTIALKSENFAVDNAMFSYFVHTECEQYVAKYENYAGADYLSVVGLDPTQSLKKQTCCYEQDTWFDYFADQAEQRVQKVLSYCGAAYAQGEADEQAVSARVEERMAVLESRAAEQEMDRDTYLAKTYGKAVKAEDVKAALRLEAMADVYVASAWQSDTFTDAQLDTFAANNPSDFLYADYQCYSVIPEFQENADDAEIEKAMQEAKKTAEDLATRMTDKSFNEVVSAHVAASGNVDTNVNLSAMPYRYNTDTQLGIWLFDENTKAGDTTVIVGNGLYTVYYRVGDLYRQEYPSANLQLIHVKLNEFANAQEMKDAVNTLTTALQQYDGSENSFKTAAKTAGFAVAEPNAVLKGTYESSDMDNWVFSTDRKVGDYQSFEAAETVYFVRFVGNGEPCWKVQARTRLAEQTQIEAEESLLKQYPVEKGKILYSRITG